MLLSATSVQAADLNGRLSGQYRAWGAATVQALSSRDLSVPPLATSQVDSSGGFSLKLPDSVNSVYLVLAPVGPISTPQFLQELPISVASANPLILPVRGPPVQRQMRHSMTGPPAWLVSLLLLLFVGLVFWRTRLALIRRLLKQQGRDHWIPQLFAVNGGTLVLSLIVALCGGLLFYGIVLLDEPMDLLEHTYFQEAFTGTNPIAILFSPVVAERAHAPGYALLLWAMHYLSHSEIWLRMPAFLSALLAAVVLFRFAAQATGRISVGWLAALLGTLAPLTMRYGRDVTPYSLVGLLCAASTWFLYSALTTGEARAWKRYAITSVLAFFMHYFTLFLLLGHLVAILWIWWRSQRGPFWTERLHQAIGYFAAMAVLPALWGGQIIRAFIISEQDNIVTQAVYLPDTGFWTYLLEHLRVVVGLPPEMSWALWPLLALIAVGYLLLLRDHPVLGRLLLIPFILLLGLLVFVYTLHMEAFGGRIYFGWRWLRPYVLCTAIPAAYAMLRPLVPIRRLLVVSLGILMLTGVTWAGVQSALTRGRPAQVTAAKTIISQIEDYDVVAVLPAAFYTPGFGYYFHDRAERYVHSGPLTWEYVPKPEGGHAQVFGPMRNFGLPLESLAGHVDMQRLWVVVFREEIFGQPEFDPLVSDQVITHLDSTHTRMNRWRYPRMEVILYKVSTFQPWTGQQVRIELNQLHRYLRWLPDALDPHGLHLAMRGKRAIRLRIPVRTQGHPIAFRITGAPASAKATDISSKNSIIRFNNGVWFGYVSSEKGDYANLSLTRSEAALKMPLVVELN